MHTAFPFYVHPSTQFEAHYMLFDWEFSHVFSVQLYIFNNSTRIFTNKGKDKVRKMDQNFLLFPI